MALRKTPEADIKRKYPLYMQIGAVGALLLLLAAFTVPLSGAEEVEVMADDQEIIEIEDIEQTKIVEPPPPPPPAPPPPEEVPDDAVIEDEIIDDIELDFDAPVSAPTGPPAPPAPPPPPPADAPAPPPPPPEPEPQEPEIFEVVEQAPVLIGGLEGLQARVKYPDLAIRGNVEGKVFVQFVVDERGQVSQAQAVRCPNQLLCDAAVRAVEESQFRPGMQRGRPVKVRFTLPVDFKLR